MFFVERRFFLAWMEDWTAFLVIDTSTVKFPRTQQILRSNHGANWVRHRWEDQTVWYHSYNCSARSGKQCPPGFSTLSLQTHPEKKIHNLPELTSFLAPVPFYSPKRLPLQATHTLGTWNTGNWLKASWDKGPILRVNEHYQAGTAMADWLKLFVSEINKSNAVAPHTGQLQSRLMQHVLSENCVSCSEKSRWVVAGTININEIKVENWSKWNQMPWLPRSVCLRVKEKQAETVCVSWNFQQIYTTHQCTDLSWFKDKQYGSAKNKSNKLLLVAVGHISDW